MSARKKFSSDPAFILLGGFLGAGKSSLLREFIRFAEGKGLRCVLVTNDQGDGLVDTALGEQTGAGVKEVPGGCFCCRADALVGALKAMGKRSRPEVYLAEPVGSCTDLMATVLRPLQEIYRMPLRVGPLAVAVDAVRYRDDFAGKKTGAGFSKGVRYIWMKQLEEAEIIVLNKADLLPARELARLEKKLAEDCPGKRVMVVSTRTGTGLEALFEMLLGTETVKQQTMEVDYNVYGKGEAKLGWYNAQLTLDMPGSSVGILPTSGRKKAGWLEAHATGCAVKPLTVRVNGNAFLLALAQAIQADLEKAGIEIGHFKMALRGRGKALAVAQAVRNGSPAELTSRMEKPVTQAELLINLRAEAAPAKLERIVARHLKGLPVRWEKMAAFRPWQPKPVHRITGAGQDGG